MRSRCEEVRGHALVHRPRMASPNRNFQRDGILQMAAARAAGVSRPENAAGPGISRMPAHSGRLIFTFDPQF